MCRAAGRVALPVPVAERLSAAPESGYDALAVVGATPRVNLAAASSDLRWAVIDGAGLRSPVTSIGPVLNTQLGSLVSPVEIGAGEDDLAALPLALTLPCWTLLGMMDSAMAMTRQHLLDRKQFGQPLASFQALQFRLADTATALQGFEELAKYTLWSVVTRSARGAGRRDRLPPRRRSRPPRSVPHGPPDARRDGLLRRGRPVVALAPQPAGSPPALGQVADPGPPPRGHDRAAVRQPLRRRARQQRTSTPFVNISMLLEMAADGYGDRIAVGSHGRWSRYARLRDEARPWRPS